VSGAASFPTPFSNAESTDSPSYSNKGKGRAENGDSDRDGRLVVRGRLMDAKRIEQFMQHQNAQHDATIRHVEHSAKVVESLR
jgi:mediator of RNA polymerase II transcription subunit 14